MKPCYLDHNAGEPLSQKVAAAINVLNTKTLGNPNSIHGLGVQARREIERGRELVAQAIGTTPSNLVFTSGGSESNRLIVTHTVVSHLSDGKRPVLLYGRSEHPSVLKPLFSFERQGLCTLRPVDLTDDGQPDFEKLRDLVGEADGLFLMAANNETGVVHDLERISRIVEGTPLHWHCDTVQLLGKEPVDFEHSQFRAVTSATLSAHKIGGPPGCGALIVRPGGKEHLVSAMSQATPNIMGIVGFAAAATDIEARVAQTRAVRNLRLALETKLERRLPDSVIHGKTTNRLPNTTAISIRSSSGWIDGEELVIDLAEAGFCVSTGAACSTDSGEPSHVLLAMGLDAEQASASLRISLGVHTTEEDIDNFVQTLSRLVPI